MADLIKGIDVSVYQGENVDFKKVKESGKEFVVIRCGVGNNGKDKVYDKNLANAKAAGLKVMAYNFVYPLPPLPNQPLRDPKKQAALHVEWAGGELVACDLEWPPPEEWKKWGCTAAQIVQWAVDYLEEYERLSGIRPIVYIYPFFADTIKLPDWFGQKYKLWIASYTKVPRIPKPWTDWVMWQDSGGEKEKLYNGSPVDTDFVKDLSLWDTVVAQPEPEPIPEPEPEPEPIPIPIPIPVEEDPIPEPAPLPDPIPPSTNPLVSGFLAIWNFLLGFLGKKK